MPASRPESASTDPLAPLRGQLGDDGWLEELGPKHLAMFRPRGDTLLVEFEALAPLLRRRSAEPWSAGIAGKRGWSTLTLISRGRTWFRDDAVFDFFDDLTDGGFFDGYDRVIFAGAGVKGYAAAAFSVAAPGATVFLCAPFATLDPEETPWEHRFRGDRSLAFGPRYGYAPDMVDAAARVYLVTDPTEAADAMHASLFRGDHVVHLKARHGGPRLGARLEAMGILDDLVAGAEEGSLTPLRFARLWRARHRDEVWLSNVLRKLDAMRRPWLQAVFAGTMWDRTRSAAARRRLNDALARLKEVGGKPPAGRQPLPDETREGMLLAGE
ncbi:phosphoadenosine phosphosulfate reductase [Jannaschia formosa]|uniref:phosphoadenosine phosphosulfate reductase n=1 Tax=Jannaschia formosa TaxID=2259592 RepID=UPI000E1B904E|nr:phosphoadenosine phosphosulfate reductase [Jannaschia formosa]TFL16974.1 phosphoadenosine phosphosulfate reductase [Jannaschia formosa]